MFNKNKRKRNVIYYGFVRFSLIFLLLCNMILVLPFIYDNTVKAGSTYYVATTGSDTTGDGSIGNPWQTITKGESMLSPGDTLNIRAGTYNEQVIINCGSDAGSWITIQNYQDEEVIIDGTGKSGEYDGVVRISNGAKYVRFTDITVKDSEHQAIYIYQSTAGTVKYIRVDNCTLYNCESSGIYVYSSIDGPSNCVKYIEIDNCSITYVQTTQEAQEALSLSHVAYFDVHHNYIAEYGKEGLCVKGDSHNGSVHHNEVDNTCAGSPSYANGHVCVYLGAGSDHTDAVMIYNNYLHGSNGQNIVLRMENTAGRCTNSRIYNNLCDNTWSNSDCIEFDTVSSSYGSFGNITVDSNTFICQRYGCRLRVYSLSDITAPCYFRNNIFVCTSNYGILTTVVTYGSGYFNFYNNCFYDTNSAVVSSWAGSTGTQFGSNAITNDNPDFVDWGGDDFRLSDSSPCIDAGSSNNPPDFDFDGNSRPMGAGYDIGAYEYYSGVSLEPPSNFRLAPKYGLESTTTTSINFAWDKGTGAERTVIQRKTTGYPTSYSDGINVYNNTGEYYDDSGLTPGQKYWYRAWSYTSVDGPTYSSGYASLVECTYPNPPYGGSAVLSTTPVFNVNLSWSKGTGANNTVILAKSGSMPSSYTDGVIVYNDTGTSTVYNITIGMPVYFKAWSYVEWGDLYKFSMSGLEFNTDVGLYVNCFDEETGLNLTFDVFVTNNDGSEVYVDTGCTNTHVINVSLLPLGEDCQIMVNASGYEARIFYLNIELGLIFHLDVYLPNSSSDTFLYGLRVVEALTYESGIVDYPVEDVIVVIKRYEENSGSFVNMSVLKTDDNGYVNLYLIAGGFYKVYLSKSGYVSSSGDYYPEPANEWGQTAEKIFRIVKIESSDDEVPDVDFLLETVLVTKYNLTSFRIYYYNPRMDSLYVVFIIYYGDVVVYSSNVSMSPNEVDFYFDYSNLSLSADVILRLVVTSHKVDDSSNVIARYFGVSQVFSSSDSSSAPVMAMISVILCIFGLTLMSPKHVLGVFGVITLVIALAFTAFSAPTWYIHLIQAVEIILLMFTFLVFKEEGASAV